MRKMCIRDRHQSHANQCHATVSHCSDLVRLCQTLQILRVLCRAVMELKKGGFMYNVFVELTHFSF